MIQPQPSDDSVGVDQRPRLSAEVRERLGRHLQALYDPVIDEALDPRLAALIGQLESDRRESSKP